MPQAPNYPINSQPAQHEVKVGAQPSSHNNPGQLRSTSNLRYIGANFFALTFLTPRSTSVSSEPPKILDP